MKSSLVHFFTLLYLTCWLTVFYVIFTWWIFIFLDYKCSPFVNQNWKLGQRDWFLWPSKSDGNNLQSVRTVIRQAKVQRVSGTCTSDPYDVDNNLLTVQARYLGDKDLPRFQFPKGSTCQVFNLPVLETLESGDELWITEGVSDCLAMLSAGKKGYCDTICHASEAENGGNDKELCW